MRPKRAVRNPNARPIEHLRNASYSGGSDKDCFYCVSQGRKSSQLIVSRRILACSDDMSLPAMYDAHYRICEDCYAHLVKQNDPRLALASCRHGFFTGCTNPECVVEHVMTT